jgi:hypothetical protein
MALLPRSLFVAVPGRPLVGCNPDLLVRTAVPTPIGSPEPGIAPIATDDFVVDWQLRTEAGEER